MRMIIAARLQVKHGSFRDLPLTRELAASLEEWFALRNREGCVATAWGSRLRTISITFPAFDGAPFRNQAFNARVKLACERDAPAQRARRQPA